MKLTHHRMTGRYDNTPESVLDWLEEQLECRGIDALVYTRYILSLLQEYDTDEDEETLPSKPGRDLRFFCCERFVRRLNCHNSMCCARDNLKPVTTNKWKHKRYLKQTSNKTSVGVSQDCWPHYDYCAHNSLNSDRERKLAVVQCLKSASEQVCHCLTF